MALKRKKGMRIETKTLKSKLHKDGIDFTQTISVYRESVAFYVQVIAEHPEHVDLSQSEMRQAYELLTLGNSAMYPFLYQDMPRDLRWDVISTAGGHYKSWQSNYNNWKKKEEKRKLLALKKNRQYKPHLPPVLPREVYDNPTYYKYSMFKDDDGKSVVIKIRRDNAWAWVKVKYSSYFYDEPWVKACPTIIFKKDGTCWLSWTLERYHNATGGIKAQQNERICSVDIDLDGDVISTLSILEPDVNGEVKEVARHFIKGHASHVRRRKRGLGKIAKKMSQTGTVSQGFAKKYWSKISRREKSEGYRIASKISDFAKRHHCRVIVFEYLTNLRPQKGKYSAKNNLKRTYWLKSKIFEYTSHIARTKHNILTSRVSPKDTSKYSAIDRQEVMRTDDMSMAELIAKNPKIWDEFCSDEGYHPGTWAVTRDGYIIHSGLNAARNIGMKFYQRYKSQKLKFVRLKLAQKLYADVSVPCVEGRQSLLP